MNFRKIIIIIVLPIVVIGIFFPGRLITTFLYYKNGSMLILKNYTINFSLTHSAYFKKIDNGYLITGRRVNGKPLKVSIYEPNISVKELLEKECDKLTYKNKEFKYIQGKMYYCFSKLTNNEVLYFQTEDNTLLLETHTYLNDITEFNLLLNGITSNISSK